ncbi:MAG TPA: GNAT family N-acetyltransferase [Vicinamibacterales bacterium]|nr:GNAT family N-acetyltransferase [Vicinamibacterales bacterium]
MRIVPCTVDRHAAAVQAIFNDAILHSTALYEDEPRTMDVIRAWFDAKARGGFPIIAAETDDGTLMGFATYGTFRDRPGYRFTVEHSVYVDARFHRQGVGRRLLEALIVRAREQRLHVMIGGIDADNAASIALHERLGFFSCGTIRQAGFKFGRWLDLAFYQLIL